MNNEMTRLKLRGMIDPELVGKISLRPITAYKIGKVYYGRELAWKMLITQTVFPWCRNQIETLERYRDLLTPDEKQIADDYADSFKQYESNWRSYPYSFPPQPEEFVNLLKESE